MTDHVVDVGEVAERVLTNRRAVVRVSEIEIKALAKFVTLTTPLSEELFAAVKDALAAHKDLVFSRTNPNAQAFAGRHLADQRLGQALDALKTIFEEEFTQ